MSGKREDGGFILVDALLAAALLAFSGTVILTIVMSSFDRQRADLDRSVALVGMQSLVKQFLLVEPAQRNRLERGDELFAYTVTRSNLPVEGTDALSQWTVVATPKAGGEPLDLAFLAPADRP